MSTPDRQRADTLLHGMLGPDAAFREGQWEAIESVLQRGSRTLVVQRTGWGKSLVYFIATKLLREQGAGPALLISPLLALMSDQIRAAERIGIRALTINSTNQDKWAAVRASLEADECDIVLISPERLANPQFRTQMLPSMQGSIALLVVDEAHCISDWGHDFRPDYRRIVRIVQTLPRAVSVLGTTATANDRVIGDVSEQIGPNLKVSRGPLGRESLQLQALSLPDQAARMAWLAERVPELPGAGIVYTLTQRDADRVAGWLRLEGIDAHSYHAGLGNERRSELERMLRNNQIKALVATLALGMGFDKPDLGWVVHYQRPGSVVAYYQQIGRAGRATDRATCVLLSGQEDDQIHEFFLSQAFPPADLLRQVAGAVEGAENGLSVQDIEGHVNLSRSRIEQCLKILEVDGVVVHEGSGYLRTLNPLVIDEGRATRVLAQRRQELQRMRDFVRLDSCLMEFAVSELDDPAAAPCGRCAVCLGGLLPTTTQPSTDRRALAFMKRSQVAIEPRKRAPAELTTSGKATIALEHRMEPGFALCTYGDPGHGLLVKRGKYDCRRFADELVEASARFIRESWRPSPELAWVAAVPSVREPTLVRDFGERLAARLGIPFVAAVRCQGERPREQQKDMHNSAMQARNAVAAFGAISEAVLPGAVLLVDDVVDSRWTLTLCAARLRGAGSGPVFPFALAYAAGKSGS